jgi:hypothetical protein
MKKALIIILTVFFAFTATLSFATENQDEAMIGDTLILRPLGILGTAVGAVVFVIGLPFSATGNNVKESADTLVVAPAKFTFARPLGDF